MKKLIFKIFLFLLIVQTIQAQQPVEGIMDSSVKNCGSCGITGRLSLGVGLGNGKIINDNSLSTKIFGLDYFYALKTSQIFDRWGDKISWGLNGGVNYFSGNGDPFAGNLPSPFKVTGSTTDVVTSSGNSKSEGYFAGVGPQLNFAFADRFVFSPIFQVGYLGVTQSEFKAVQTTTLNGAAGSTSKNYTLISQTETNTNGLGFIPKARLTYMITNKIGLWAEASYLLGPTVKNSITTFKPEPNTVIGGSYSIQQMDRGTYTTEVKETKHNVLGYNFGVVFSIGSRTDTHIPIKPERLEPVVEVNPIIEEMKFPIEIQKIIDAQDNTPTKNFKYVNNTSNQTTQSLCNFLIEKVDIKCDGKDQKGSKKYKVDISYKNLAPTNASLGHYLTACSPTATNGNYIDVNPSGSATISNLLPNTTTKTIIPAGSTQSITFDFVPNSGFTSINIQGNLINSATSCGNCDDIISLNLPDCCDACELNPVGGGNSSIAVLNANTGTIRVRNYVTSPNVITRIVADLVSVSVTPDNSDCNKCNNLVKQQDNFVESNNIINNLGWANAGESLPKPDYPLGASRTLVFNSATASGISIPSGISINHTIGVAPSSCCGDTVVIWIRYSVWDKHCKVCDKLISATIKRPTACVTTGTGTGGSGSSSAASQLNTNLKKQ